MIGWLSRLLNPHVCNKVDLCVFDSSIQYTLGTDKKRICGQAVMTYCYECGSTGRRPLKTWAEARIARRRLGYGRPIDRDFLATLNREPVRLSGDPTHLHIENCTVIDCETGKPAKPWSATQKAEGATDV